MSNTDGLNVILFPPDTVRADHLSCYGYGRETSPRLDRMAGEGVLFKDHYANSGWTQPQYMSIHTSMYPVTHGASRIKFTIPLSPNITTLGEVLRENGYMAKAYTSTNHWVHPIMGYGRGFDDYVHGLGSSRACHRIVDEALKWIEEIGKKRKFFCFIHTHDTHEPFNPPEPFDSKWGGEYMDQYDGEISWVDHNFGRIIDKLEEMGIRDRTLLIYSADHGTEFYEHGYIEKAVNLYDEIIHIPLVMSCPGVLPEGLTVNGVNETVDLVPTILDILDLPPKKDAQGSSLLPVMRGEKNTAQKDRIYCHTAHVSRKAVSQDPCYEHVCLRTDTHKLIRAEILHPFTDEYFEVFDQKRQADRRMSAIFGTAAMDWMARFRSIAERAGMDPGDIEQGTVLRELYDVAADPGEQKNVLKDRPELAQELEGNLQRWLDECREAHDRYYEGVPAVFLDMPTAYKVSIRTSKALGSAEVTDGYDKDIIPMCPLPIRINAGGEKYTDSSGQQWLSDRGMIGDFSFVKRGWGYITGDDVCDEIGTSKPIDGSEDQPLHQSQRFGQDYAYRFYVPNGKYRVNLHFSETLMSVGIEMFDVCIQDETVLKGFCIFQEAGGMNRAVVKSFEAEVTEKRLTVGLRGVMEPQQEAAKVAAIEILPAGGSSGL